MGNRDFSARAIQVAFKEAGAAVPNPDRAQEIANALPFGAVATGMAPSEVLQTCIENRENGAIERLLNAKRRLDRRDAYNKRQKRRQTKTVGGRQQ